MIYKTGIKALLAGTSRGSASLRHREFTNYCENDAQVISDVYTDIICGNIKPQEEDFDPCESDIWAPLKNYFSWSIIERRRLTFVTECKSALESKYCSQEQAARANQVGCDY